MSLAPKINDTPRIRAATETRRLLNSTQPSQKQGQAVPCVLVLVHQDAKPGCGKYYPVGNHTLLAHHRTNSCHRPRLWFLHGRPRARNHLSESKEHQRQQPTPKASTSRGQQGRRRLQSDPGTPRGWDSSLLTATIPYPRFILQKGQLCKV